MRCSTTVPSDGALDASLSKRTMKIDTAHAEPMGTLMVEGSHRPFHALACALQPSTVRIKHKIRSMAAQ